MSLFRKVTELGAASTAELVKQHVRRRGATAAERKHSRSARNLERNTVLSSGYAADRRRTYRQTRVMRQGAQDIERILWLDAVLIHFNLLVGRDAMSGQECRHVGRNVHASREQCGAEFIMIVAVN